MNKWERRRQMILNDKKYWDAVTRVKNIFDELPRGAKMTASFDLRLPASIISQVVHGTMYRPDVIEMLEKWLETQSVGQTQ